MDITNRHTVETAFATTYGKSDSSHPLRQFEQYDLVMAHRDNKPNVGARRLSRRLDLSEGRIDGWLKGSKPEGYDIFHNLRERGWFDLSWDGEQFRALNQLLAWTYASGGIATGFLVQLVYDTPDDRAECVALIEQLGAEYTEQRTGHDRKPSQFTITPPGAGTGRLFVALGAPIGKKAGQRFGVPAYLSVAPDDVRCEFAARYLGLRGSERPNHAESALDIREQRHDSYLEALRGLFSSLTSSDVRRSGENGIYVSGEAVEEILGKATLSIE